MRDLFTICSETATLTGWLDLSSGERVRFERGVATELHHGDTIAKARAEAWDYMTCLRHLAGIVDELALRTGRLIYIDGDAPLEPCEPLNPAHGRPRRVPRPKAVIYKTRISPRDARWTPTHLLTFITPAVTHSGQWLVSLASDGNARTAGEQAYELEAAWRVVDGQWQFVGRATPLDLDGTLTIDKVEMTDRI
jgi:hypothetical protein